MSKPPYARALELLLKQVPDQPDDPRRLGDLVNLHQKIGDLYRQFDVPWCVPHYERARRYWEAYRQSLSHVESRRHLFAQQGQHLYSSLGSACLKIAGGTADWFVPHGNDRVAAAFVRDGGNLRTENDWIETAFEAFDGMAARTHLDWVSGSVPIPSARAIRQRLIDSQESVAALLMMPFVEHTDCIILSKEGWSHRRLDLGGEEIDVMRQQFDEAFRSRHFDPIRPNLNVNHAWREFQKGIEPLKEVIRSVEPQTTLALAGAESVTNLPLGGMKIDDRYLIDRHSLANVSSIAQWALAARRKINSRKLLSIGVGRADRTRERQLDFNPLGAPCTLAACRTFDVSPLFSTIALFSSKL